jgi:hypothetical protein
MLPRVSRIGVWGVAGALAAFLTLVCWAVSSPPGSSPDEPFHLGSIWCGQGLDDDHCRTDPNNPDSRLVPQEVALGQCWTGNSAQSALCRPSGYGDHLQANFPDIVGNWNDSGGYPPVYYAVMHVFASGNYDASVLTIRIFNAALMVLVVGGLVLLLPDRLRRIPTTAFVAASVPMGLFLGGSVNPSTWANIGIGTLWLAVYAAYEATGTRQRLLWAFILLATLVGPGARADATLFAILGVGLALGLRLTELRRQWQTTLVAGVAILLAALLFLTSGHASAVSEGIPGYVAAPATGWQLALANALNVPFLWMGSLGLGPLAALGWFDTPLPFVTGFVSLVLCGWVLLSGWADAWWQKTTAIVILVAAMTAYPIIVLQESHIFAGNGVQPRYLLPLLLMLVGISVLPSRTSPSWSRLQVVAAVVALSVAQSAALYANISRYVKGVPVTQIGTLGGTHWWWDGDLPGSPWAVWVLGSLTFAVLCAAVFRQWWPTGGESLARPRLTAPAASRRKTPDAEQAAPG